MTALFSQEWYRIARLRLQLRPQVQVQRQHWRNERWYLLSDGATGRQHRIDAAAYRFIGRCDGQRTVHEVWHALLDNHPDDAPTQADVLALLGRLHEHELLQSDRAADIGSLLERRARTQQQQRRQRGSWLNPLSFRIALGDPSRLLDRLAPRLRVLGHPVVGWLWLAFMLAAALVAAAEWPALRSHAAQLVHAPLAPALPWLVYPLLKLLHELGHALVLRHFGGEVHEAGIGLMLLLPAPYVDASAASALPRRRERAAVGAAGVVVEATLAALALVLWQASQPGLLHDLALAVMVIGIASTLLFNANPLLRFDGYHVLCDVFELPNLAARSGAWWRHRLARVLLGSRAAAPPHAAGELAWLVGYAPLSLVYRVVLSAALVTWLGGLWWPAGCAVAVASVYSVLLQPLAGWSRDALAAAAPGRDSARLRLRLGALAAMALGGVFLLPLSLVSVAPAVVWLPEQAQLRPGVDGFVAELPLADGAPVRAGDLLLRLANPELLSTRDQLASRLDGLRAEHYQLLLRDPNAAQNLQIDIDRAQAELARAEERVGQLEVRAATAGRLVLPRPADLPGRWVRHGETLGQVLAASELRVRAAVPEHDAHLLRERLRGAEVRLADAPQRALVAQVIGRDAPTLTRLLPSAALAAAAGGPYPVDPAEKDGLHSLTPVVLVDLSLPGRTLERVGGRAWVRFDLGREPLALQLWRRGMQVFLRQTATQQP